MCIGPPDVLPNDYVDHDMHFLMVDGVWQSEWDVGIFVICSKYCDFDAFNSSQQFDCHICERRASMALALESFGEPDRCRWCQRTVADQNVGKGNKCPVCARRAYERWQWQQMQARLMKAAALAALDNIAKIKGTVVPTLRHGFRPTKPTKLKSSDRDSFGEGSSLQGP